MTAMTAVDARMGGAASIELVKWDTPTDELLGVARVIQHLLNSHEACAHDVCIAAPNRVWAVQARRACESIGLEAVLCEPVEKLSAAARVALSKLDLLLAFKEGSTDSGSDRFDQAASSSGLSPEEASRFASVYADARGFTLIHALGFDEVSEADVALLHIAGDEDASSLQKVMAEQLSNPTVPNGSSVVSVRLMDSLDQECKRLFLIGCVDGLVPRAAVGDVESQRALSGASDAAAASFAKAIGLAQQSVVVSGFSKIDIDVAQRAHIKSVRSRMEHGKRMAMVALTPFLLDGGSARPTTVGGQAYLRSYGLN